MGDRARLKEPLRRSGWYLTCEIRDRQEPGHTDLSRGGGAWAAPWVVGEESPAPGWVSGYSNWVDGGHWGMCDPIQSTLSTPAIKSHLFLPSRLRPLGRPRWALTSQSLVAPAGQQGRRVNSSDRVTDLLAMLPVLAGQAGLGSPCPTRPAKARTPAQEPGDPSTAQMPCLQCPLLHAAFSHASTWPPSFPAKEGYQTRPLPRPGPCTAACRASPVTPTLPSELEGPGPSEPTVLTQVATQL